MPRDVRVEVAAVLMIKDVRSEVDSTATLWVQEQLTKFAVDIKNTTGATRDAYTKVHEQTSRLERVGIELPTNELAPTEDSEGSAYPTFERHLYADAYGRFPLKLNDWETSVVMTEIARKSTVAWYRNPARATPSALRIAYQDESGTWKSRSIVSTETSISPLMSEVARGVGILEGASGSAELLGDVLGVLPALTARLQLGRRDRSAVARRRGTLRAGTWCKSLTEHLEVDIVCSWLRCSEVRST